ncbi:helix-turn-helix domain-containing protein [Methylobacterium sp. J-076]|uniref:helix-turn-helix domain-containing protein n=1 Tax=Methylobacterium sp. J-076 TaxID=2836655 RepID=UPI001FBA25A3|nr:helix-turn-helix domain-containing protein [Methylobacterium sp. J-076]MCJ2011803.1 helix-turn-helix domain-containing protein [Methylobacterium sp. J-076]
MDYADAIRRQAEDAPRAALPAVTAALWRAFAEGHVSEAEAEALSALIELRQVSPRSGGNSRPPISGTQKLGGADADRLAPQDRHRSPRTGVGSRPRSDASLERRRRWAASGRLPPALAARFTLAEQAALALVAAETARRGDCRLSVPHIAAVAGVAETTVRNAIREAKKLGLLTVEERRLTGFRNDTNVVRIVSPEWTAWLRLGRKGDPLSKSGSCARHAKPGGGGCKSPNRTPTQVLEHGKTRAEKALRDRSANPKSPLRTALRVAGA